MVAAGVGMWWWRSRRGGTVIELVERGSVIFDNTPRASSPDGNI